MAYLIGFRATKKSQGNKADENNIVDLVLKSYLNRTAYGEFSTVEEVDGAIKTLSGLPQNIYVQEKVADLNNKKLQISAKKDDILKSKGMFEEELRAAKVAAASDSLNDPRQLIGKLASVYEIARQGYEDYMYSRIAERYGSEAELPPEILSYNKELDEQAKFYSTLYNAYNTELTTGEQWINPNSFGVVVETNPATRKIFNVEITSADKLDLKKYMKTDTPIQVGGGGLTGLPLYLPVVDGKMTEDGVQVKEAILGGFTYRGVKSKNQGDDIGDLNLGTLSLVKPKAENEPFLRDVARFLLPKSVEKKKFGDEPEDKAGFKGAVSNYEQMKTNGIALGNFAFDKYAIPKESVVVVGGKTFFASENDDELFEIAGKDSNEVKNNLTKFLKETGRDETKALTPYYTDRNFLYKQNDAGSMETKVRETIDSNFFSPESATPQTVAPMTTPQAMQPTEAPTVAKAGFFAEKQTSTPSIIKDREGVPGKPAGTGIIEKGKSFFKKAWDASQW